MPALVDHGRDQILAHQVEDGRAQRRTLRSDDAVWRPRGDEVGGVGEVTGGDFVVVAGRDHEVVFLFEMAQVPRDHRGHLHAAFDWQSPALDEVVLDVHDQKRVAHGYMIVAGAHPAFALHSYLWPCCRRGGTADAPDLGSGARKGVEVQILSPTPWPRSPSWGVVGRST